MKKKIVLFLCILMLLCITGCGDKKETGRNGEKIVDWQGYELLESLGEGLLSDEELKNEDEINTVVDAFKFVKSNTFDNSKQAVEKCGELLYGDYDELDEIVVDGYSLLSVKINNKYYPIDVFSENKIWLENYQLDKYSFDTKEEMCTKLNGQSFKLIMFNGERIVESEKYGVPIYTYKGFEIPVELGYPKLTDKQINEITESSAESMITTYVDALVYLYNKLFDRVKPVNMNAMPKSDSELTEPMFYATYAKLLFGDYSEVHRLDITSNGDSQGRGGCTFFICLRGFDDMYYWLNMYEQVVIGEKGWLNNYYDSKYTGNKYCFDDINSVLAALSDETINASLAYHSSRKKITSEQLSGEDDYVNEKADFVVGNDGRKYQVVNKHGTEVFIYHKFQFPLGLGLPEISEEEMEDLINTSDYESIASKINTLADAAYYMVKAGFVMNMDKPETIKFKDVRVGDFGNVQYEDETFYSTSGLELLQLRIGQCSSASTLMSYLLKDNYKELGYLLLRFSDNDGHAMIYIKNDDDIYYLVDPVKYLMPYDKEYIYLNQYDYIWLDMLDNDEKGSAKSLNELADTMINKKTPWKENDVVLNALVSFCYDGVFCEGYKTMKFDKPGNTIYVPKGSNPISYNDFVNVEEIEMKHSTSQTHIIGLSEIFESPYKTRAVVNEKYGEN